MTDTSAHDRFDDVRPDDGRSGAHRVPRPRMRGRVRLAWAALATGILVAAGVLGLGLLGSGGGVDIPFPTAAGSPSQTLSASPTVAPALDPAVPITVLNGTTASGLAGEVGDLLVESGWGGAATGVGTRASADESDIASTVVYYADASRESAARALVEDLGIGSVQLSDLYPASPITVVLGEDYVLPPS